MSGCKAHGEGCFDDRLCYLTELYNAGWGSVPMHLIEEALAANGGVLPAEPPAQYRDASVDPEYQRRKQAWKTRLANRERLTQEQLDSIPVMAAQGMSIPAIARELGVSRCMVRPRVQAALSARRGAVVLRKRRAA